MTMPRRDVLHQCEAARHWPAGPQTAHLIPTFQGTFWPVWAAVIDKAHRISCLSQKGALISWLCSLPDCRDHIRTGQSGDINHRPASGRATPVSPCHVIVKRNCIMCRALSLERAAQNKQDTAWRCLKQLPAAANHGRAPGFHHCNAEDPGEQVGCSWGKRQGDVPQRQCLAPKRVKCKPDVPHVSCRVAAHSCNQHQDSAPAEFEWVPISLRWQYAQVSTLPFSPATRVTLLSWRISCYVGAEVTQLHPWGKIPPDQLLRPCWSTMASECSVHKDPLLDGEQAPLQAAAPA